MCENIDDNMGRVLAKLEELKIADDTIFIYLSDNGPNTDRYNAGMKGRKGSAHEGGGRVPFFIRYPRRISPGKVIEPIAAHIDLLPTLMEYCGVRNYKTKPLDGRSLVPLIESKPSLMIRCKNKTSPKPSRMCSPGLAPLTVSGSRMPPPPGSIPCPFTSVIPLGTRWCWRGTMPT